MKSTLNNLQNDFLREFFARENHFFLTGGAALVGFYFGHRKTEDLDLFTLENEIENGFAIVKEVAQLLDATVESIQTSPDFRRLLVKPGLRHRFRLTSKVHLNRLFTAYMNWKVLR